jgi:Transglutaminase-like superfamily
VVTTTLAPKWTPHGFAQRLRRIFHAPSDFTLALRVGLFMWRAPEMLRRRNLKIFLDDLRAQPRPKASNASASLERIQRLRQLCLRLPIMRSRDNCYVRAITLYRFLDPGQDFVNVHFGIEEKDDPRERLRGHAWVTLNGHLLEGPPEPIFGKLKEVPLPSVDPHR